MIALSFLRSNSAQYCSMPGIAICRSCRERLELRRRALNSSKGKGLHTSPGSSAHPKAPQRQSSAPSAAATGAQAATAVGPSAAAAGNAQHYAAADVPDDIYSQSWGVQQMLQYGQVPCACTAAAAAAAAASTSPPQLVHQQLQQPVLQQGGQHNGNLPLHHTTSVGDFDDYLHAVMQDELQSCLQQQQQQQQHEDAATLLQPGSTLPGQSSAVQGGTAQALSYLAHSSAALHHPGANTAATWGAAAAAAGGGGAAAGGALPQVHVSSQAVTGPPLWPVGQPDAAFQGTAPTSSSGARRQLLLQQLQDLMDLKAARMQDTAASGSVPTAGLPAAAALRAPPGPNQGYTTVFAPSSSTWPSPTLGFGSAAPALQSPAAGQHMAALQQLPAMQPALVPQEMLTGAWSNPALPVGFSAGMQGLPGSTSTLSAPLLVPLGHWNEGLQRAVTLQPLGHTSEGLQRAVTLQHQQGAATGPPGALSRTGIAEQMEALQQQVQEASAQLMRLQESLGLNAASS